MKLDNKSMYVYIDIYAASVGQVMFCILGPDPRHWVSISTKPLPTQLEFVARKTNLYQQLFTPPPGFVLTSSRNYFFQNKGIMHDFLFRKFTTPDSAQHTVVVNVKKGNQGIGVFIMRFARR